ncbi:ftsH [Symbiodinium pilosum]|uniref:FtsH protein n=1 Tax=Symbiodinium pilosum TaxID=2952 RepID=A0A812W608_SYMPI|nr:ftsH [Symbiodinium pilosum]
MLIPGVGLLCRRWTKRLARCASHYARSSPKKRFLCGYYAFLAEDKILFLAVVSHEEPPLAIFELLDRVYQVLFRYLGEVSEDALRQNFSTVYLLLDEMIDSGLPFTTELNSLESIIAPPSAIGKVVQAVSGSSTQVLSDVPLESAGQAGPLGALSSALGALSHAQIGGASAEVWWRKQNVAYGSNEAYVDIVETVSCMCNGSGHIVSGGISGEILMTSKLSGVPEVLLSLRNPSILQNVSFHPCVKLPRYHRDKALSFIPPDGEFSLANYWIPDITLNLPFHFSVSVNYHSDHGKVQIAASPKLAVTMQHKQMLIDKFVVNVRLPASIAGANLACQGGSVRFDDESKVIVWNLGKLASQESKAEGTLTYATNPKDGSVQIPDEEKSTAQLAFQIKGWAISGIRLDACDVTSVNYTPYKASRYTTTAGKIEYRYSYGRLAYEGEAASEVIASCSAAKRDQDGEGSDWEVDPTQLVAAVSGASLAYWAWGRMRSQAPHSPGTPSLEAPPSVTRIPLSEFLSLLRDGAVTAVSYLADRPPAGALLLKAAVPTLATIASQSGKPLAAPARAEQSMETLLLPGSHQGVFEELRSRSDVKFECREMPAGSDSEMNRLSLLIDLGGLVASLGALWYMLRSNGQTFTAKHLEENRDFNRRPAVTFEDVAGMEVTKEELQEVIAYLRDPNRFYALGARPPRGILLAGPSGTGKTLMARAVAGEAGVPFLYASSASFVEIFVGQGAQRIRQFFEQARACAPCIVFLDELDAVGSSRQMSASGGGGNQEYAQTLNQLLLELDGVESNAAGAPVVVTIAATNRYHCLDEALVRPGRLDRIVMVNLPNHSERVATLQIHAAKLKTENLDLNLLARRTEGMSGADLANLLNEAALLAARRRADAVRAVPRAFDHLPAGMMSSV